MQKLLLLGCVVLLLLHTVDAITTEIAFTLAKQAGVTCLELNPITNKAREHSCLTALNIFWVVAMASALLALLWLTHGTALTPLAIVAVWLLCAFRMLVVISNTVQILKVL